MNIKLSEVIVLENGDVLAGPHFHKQLIGNTSEVETWASLLKARTYNKEELSTLINRVWGKVPTPALFLATYEATYNGIELKELGPALEVMVPTLTNKKVTLTTSNPFLLSDEETTIITSLVEADRARQKEVLAQHQKQYLAKEAALLEAIKAMLESCANTNCRLEADGRGDGTRLSHYSVVMLYNGIAVTTLKVEAFAEKACPEAWALFNQ